MRTTFKFFILAITCLTALFFDILLGSAIIPISEVWNSFFTNETSIFSEIILNYRVPKAITALLIGAALANAGLLMQTLFKNPLAGPDVLGINSGASLGVAIITLGGVSMSTILGGYTQVMAAILGASTILLLILAISTKVKSSISLLIVGVMFGYFTSSVVSILQSISNPDSLKLFITWTFGSLSGVSWNQLAVLSPIILLTLFCSFLIIKQLNVFLLGNDYAQALGVNTSTIRIYIIIITALLTGAATAFTGPIGFIGITTPHIARGLFKTSNHKIVLPASILLGSTILMLCDIISQLPGLKMSLPINAVTSLFGAPIILWIILKRK